MKQLLPLTNGIFGHMTYTFDYEITKDQLDLLLLSNIGQRNPSPVVDVVHGDEWEGPISQLTDAELTKLASVMLATYKPKWDKLADVYSIEYDPIHNYLDEWEDENDGTENVDETINVDRTDTFGTTVATSSTRTDNLSQLETRNLATSNEREFDNSEETTFGKTNTRTDDFDVATTYGRTETETDNLAIANTGTQTTAVQNDTTVDSVWGFNSSNDVNADKSVNNGTTLRTDNLNEAHTGTVTKALSGTDTEAHDGTVTDALSGKDKTAYDGTVTDSGTSTGTVTTANTGTQSTSGTVGTTGTNDRDTATTRDTDTTDHRERSGRHFGNIGNLTSQKMILEEIELWKWSYINEVLDDAKNFLTLPIYI
jgi:hypothetical protein